MNWNVTLKCKISSLFYSQIIFIGQKYLKKWYFLVDKTVKHNNLVIKRGKIIHISRTDMTKFNRRFHGNAGDGHLHTYHIWTPEVLPFHMTPSNLCRGVKRIQFIVSHVPHPPSGTFLHPWFDHLRPRPKMAHP